MSSSSNSSGNQFVPDAYLFPNEPNKFNEDSFHELLIYLSKTGASDIKIQTNNQIFAKIHGKVYKITKRSLPPPEVEFILSVLYGVNGPARIKSGQAIDKAYELHPTRTERYRYRVNAVGGVRDGVKGIEITCRTIVIDPLTMDQLGVEEGIRAGAFPHDGIVIMAGATGSGKSTTLASFIRSMLEEPDGHRFIMTFEAPIEYVYDSIQKPSSLIWQTEIGPDADLPDFVAGIRSAMRRAPDVILNGEMRDIETVESTIAASESGHAVYSTVHANSVVDTFRRIVNFFPFGARGAVMAGLISSVRMVVWQRLLPRVDVKGRVAIREYLVFTDELREQLLSIGMDNLDKILLHLRKLVNEEGQSAAACAQRFYDEGKISSAQLISVAGSS